MVNEISSKLKYLFLIACVFGAGFLAYSVFKSKSRLHEELIGQQQKYQQLSEYAAKLEIQYKSQEDLKKKAEEKFKDEMSYMQGRIKILSDATFLIKEKARETNNSDVIFDGPNSQFVLNEIRFNDGPAVGYVLIFKDGRVVSKLYNHQIKLHTLVTRDERTGRYEIASKSDFILKSPSLNQKGKNWFNVPYPLKIVDGIAQIDPTEPNELEKYFQFWNPKANLNVNLDPSRVSPGLGISLMAYGRTLNDLDYKFIQFGLQLQDSKLQPTFTPVLWRPFTGLLSNTYIGPGVAFSNPGFTYYLGVQVGL